MLEKSAGEVPEEVCTQRPARTEVPEHPEEVRDAGEHHPAVGHGLGKVHGLVVHAERDIPEHAEVETGCGDDDVGLELAAGLGEDALLGKPIDLVGHHLGLAGLDPLKKVTVGNEGKTLLPRAVARREVLHVVPLGQVRLHVGEEHLAQLFGLVERHLGDGFLIVQDPAAHDLVDPLLGHLKLTQLIRKVVAVASGPEIRWRSLQHVHLAGRRRHCGHHRCCGCPRADDDHCLVGVVEIGRPGLRVHDATREAVHPLPLRRVALGMPVVALTHPQEVGGEHLLLPG
ncbi:unannotated protein [freshwater metagenome]|uniref:Unannotated protein n=1 Tax=freshwater metagenome TaxID=449393 RepID=A0A6J6S1L5_9ZZZZ